MLIRAWGKRIQTFKKNHSLTLSLLLTNIDMGQPAVAAGLKHIRVFQPQHLAGLGDDFLFGGIRHVRHIDD